MRSTMLMALADGIANRDRRRIEPDLCEKLLIDKILDNFDLGAAPMISKM